MVGWRCLRGLRFDPRRLSGYIYSTENLNFCVDRGVLTPFQWGCQKKKRLLFRKVSPQNLGVDSKPFFEFNMLDIKEPHVAELKKFSKSSFEYILIVESNAEYDCEFTD